MNAFAIEHSQVPLVKFLFKRDWIDLQLEEEPQDFQKLEELLEFLKGQSSALILVAVNSKEDLAFLAELDHQLKFLPHKKLLRLVVVDFVNHHFDMIIAKLTIQEVIDAKINRKGFKHKLDFWLQSIANTEIERSNTKPLKQSQLKLVTKVSRNSEDSVIGKLTEHATLSSIICQGSSINPSILDDFYENTFIFKLGKNQFMVGDVVDFFVKGKYLNMEFFMKAKGKVTDIKEEADGSVYVDIWALESQEAELEDMMNLYLERQKNITDFMNEVKGIAS